MKPRQKSALCFSVRPSNWLGLCTLTFSLLAVGSALAQTSTWDGGGASGLWSLNTNWTTDTLPTPATATTYNLGGNVENTLNNDLTGVQAVSIRFTNNGLGSNTNAFTLAGSLITLTTQNNAVFTQTIGAGGTSITDTLSANLTATGIRQFNIGLGHDLIFSGALSGTGGTISKGGQGTLTISGGNSYTAGLTYIDSGTLKLGGNNVIPNTSSPELKRGSTTDTNPILDLAGFSDTINGINFGHTTTTATTLGGQPSIIDSATTKGILTLGGNINYRAGSAGFLNGQATISANLATGNAARNIFVANGSATDDLVISGAISGSGNITKQGAGILLLSGANTHTGQLNLETGIVKFGASNVLPDANAVQMGINASLTGSTIDLNGFSETIGNLAIGGAGGANNPTAAGNAHSIINTGASGAVLTLGGTFAYNTGVANQNAQATISANLDTGASNRNLTVGDSTHASAVSIDLLISGAIVGTNGFNKAGAGTLALSAANTFNGVSRPGTGILLLQNNLALQNSPVNLETSSTGTITLDTGITTPTFGGLRGERNLVSVITSGYSGVTQLTLNNGIDSTSVYSGGIADGATGMVLVKSGAGTQVFTGSNSYTGKTTVEAGTLRFGRVNSLYAGNSANWTAANINVKSGAILALNADSAGTGGFTAANLDSLLANISVAGTSAEGLQAGAILGLETSNATGDSFTQGNAIADSTGSSGGAIGLAKLGTKTLVLDKVNTYTGATTVTGGKLLVTNSIANSAVSVTGIGTILASGTTATIGSSVVMNSGTILAVGDEANATTATATVGGASTLNNGSIFSWDINGTGTAYDKLVTTGVSGEVTPGDAIFRIVVAESTFADTFWTTNQSWTDVFTTDGTAAIASWATVFGSTVSVVDSSFATLDTATYGTFSITGNTVNWTAVPEPTTALAGLLLTAGLLRRRRA